MPESRLTNVDLERLIDFISAGFIILMPDGGVAYINEFAAAALGEPAEALVGTRLWERPGAQDGEIQRRLAHAHEQGEAAEFDVRVPHTGNWLRIHAFPSADSMVVYFLDNTLVHQASARTEIETAVSHVLATSMSLEEAAPRLIQAICAKLEVDAGALWLARAPGGALSCAEFRVWTDSTPAMESFAEVSLASTLQPGEGIPGQVLLQRAPLSIVELANSSALAREAGDLVPFTSGFAFPIIADEDVLGVLEFFARRRMDFRAPKMGMMAFLGHEIGQFALRWRAHRAFLSEEAVRAAVLQSALDAIIIMDGDGLIQEFNPAAEQIFGYDREEVLGRRLSECVIPPDGRQAHEDGYRRFIATGEAHILGRRVEVRAMRADQSTFPCELAITQAFLSGETPTFVGFVRDITERKQAEDRLIQARAQAEQMTRLKSSLLANMSHEIRTPLTSMMIWTTVLRESTPDAQQLSPTQLRAMQTIERSAQRLADTLESILTLAQLEGRALDPEMQPVAIADIAREVVEQFKPAAAQKNLQLSLLGELADLQVEADPAFVRRILINLVSNAVKFTPRGEVSVLLSAQDERVVVEVRDTGIGIHPEFISRIFEDFVQESTGFARNYEGSGLGLAISKRLVEAMGGQLEVVSQEGVGTAFTVTLRRQEEQPEQPAASVADTLLQAGASRERRILLVEDNADIREAIEEALGIVTIIEAFVRAEEALERAREVEFDLVLMDISLPGMDGLQALRELQRLPGYADVPVIALTGHAMPGDREYLIHHGFNDYLAKPFKIDRLLMEVDRWLPVARE